jgi:hypothetical protein
VRPWVDVDSNGSVAALRIASPVEPHAVHTRHFDRDGDGELAGISRRALHVDVATVAGLGIESTLTDHIDRAVSDSPSPWQAARVRRQVKAVKRLGKDDVAGFRSP